ncbi:hypothetical protein KIN20_034043 [Parelaphostrongylus tenuis]|uniref:Uncharacterized protein n=1 Tax=Parelaphostrongylus tenuis TaxID=148309 RepID=A0AAD5WJD6_PARTN|nr:hypothetical protein KIN20_034043 [Parelaphostrongylus tenuis]
MEKLVLDQTSQKQGSGEADSFWMSIKVCYLNFSELRLSRLESQYDKRLNSAAQQEKARDTTFIIFAMTAAEIGHYSCVREVLNRRRDDDPGSAH